MRKMKNSGIEWIGEIPDGWICLKSKYLMASNDGGIWGNDSLNTDKDKIVLRSTEQSVDGKWLIENPAKRDLSGLSYQKYRILPNDLLMTKSSGSPIHIGKTTLADERFLEQEFYYSNFLQRIRLTTEYHPLFAWFVFNATFVREQFAYMQNSTSGLGNINSSNIRNVLIPRPNINTQIKIANHLDKKCGKIDHLISNIQTQVEKLKEYKQSVITEAVTKGLDPTAPMKDSGIPWIGNIPTSWEVSRVGRHYNIILGKMLCDKQLKADYTFEDYLCAANIHFDCIEMNNLKKMWFSPIEKENYIVKSGDLVVVEGGAGAGGSNIITQIFTPTYIQNSVMIVRNKTNTDNRYLKYWIECLVKKGYIDVICNKATIPHFTKDKLSAMPLPVLSPIRQAEIADYLDQKCSKIDRLIQLKQQKIEKLQEYKKSLIYEYVTGKKEVL